MTRMSARTAAMSLVVVALAGSTLTACGEKSINKDDMVKNVQTQMKDQMPAGTTLDCPQAPEAKAGSKVRCTWTYANPTELGMPDGTKLGTTIEVTSVEGDKAQFNVQNDTYLTGKDGATIAPSELPLKTP